MRMVFLLRTSFEMKSKQTYHRHRIQTRIKTVSDCNSHRDGSKNRTQGNETQGNETQRRKDARVQREEEEEEKRGEERSGVRVRVRVRVKIEKEKLGLRT